MNLERKKAYLAENYLKNNNCTVTNNDFNRDGGEGELNVPALVFDIQEQPI